MKMAMEFDVRRGMKPPIWASVYAHHLRGMTRANRIITANSPDRVIWPFSPSGGFASVFRVHHITPCKLTLTDGQYVQ